MNTTSSSDTSGNTSKTVDSVDSKAETVYSAQSTGEFNMSAIHYSLDFEGWINNQLNKMYQVFVNLLALENISSSET